ncbi:cation:proton antiporter [Amycolatopsis suaedae]|uniref:Sodium:proton antiporter n=1 Tax=Amycolatopsis suaedae TaxID=2510978 RepID=A0A4Q7J8L8_9PSEU|nr:cation:proton antiporter [Amycolatopsis suaedae]RZQ62454.1 sodium:proton antiporter [Amycolatopsis suaedae]
MATTATVLITAAGVATLAAAVVPRMVRQVPVSMPMVFLAAGALTFGLVGGLSPPDPVRYAPVTRHLAELCVVVSLMGAGLALNRRVGLRRWSTTWRLLAVTMPVSMLSAGLLGWGLLGLGVAGAVLLGAVLAPTDPVLATEVQVGEPATDDTGDDEPRFSLTSEAGLNDGLAFPFVHAAVAISLAGVAPSGWLGEWLAVDVLWRLVAGVGLGVLAGRLLRKLFFSASSEKYRLAGHAEGFVALAATFLTYGVTELVQGYGFVAVFVCGCTLRAGERPHDYHVVLHRFVEQVERLLTVVIIFLLGGAAVTGLLAGTTWREVLVAVLVLLVVRPVAGLAGLLRSDLGRRERAVVAFFGVRGVGSVFYLAYALAEGRFAAADSLWRVVGLVVIGSILVHGVTATPAMKRLDRG